jgi:hypothetical protein
MKTTWVLAVGLWGVLAAQGAGVPPRECFPFESLPPDQRKLAEDTLQHALDSEALFTLVTGLKPMGSAILTEERRLFLDTRKPQLPQLEAYREIAARWRCGREIWSGVQALKYVITPAHDGRATAPAGENPQGLIPHRRERPEMSGYPTKVRELSWDSGGRYLATGGSAIVTIRDCGGKGPASSRALHLDGHETVLTALEFQHRGELAMSGRAIFAWRLSAALHNGGADPRLGEARVAYDGAGDARHGSLGSGGASGRPA